MVNDVLARLATALSDRYRIERELGAGGMATVYLAHDLKHDRDVAIKVLHPDLGAALGGERFLSEIRTTARLQHPHILPLLDSGEADRLLYYVMPLVTGETLRARLARERQLPIADAIRLASQVASALDYAHRQGVIHRDIKPENILLHDGAALVADFGIALAVQQAGGHRLTQTGLSLGTPKYMAPEQAMGESTVDARADVWALGVTTYEMLAGDPPFAGPSAQAIVSKVLTADPTPLTELRKSVPAHVADTIAMALEKLPADRHTSAAAFASALADSTTRRPAAPASAPRSRTMVARAVPWIVGMGAGALLGVAGYASLNRTGVEGTRMPVRFMITPPDSVVLQAVCCGQMMALSPDGRTLVFQGQSAVRDSANPNPVQRLYARSLGELGARAISGTEGATALSFSPDGSQLAFFIGQRLMRVALSGGSPQPVATLPNGYVSGSTWVSNDRLIVCVGTALYDVSINGEAVKVLLPPELTALQPTAPSFVPEGNAVLFAYANLDAPPVVQWLPLGSKTPRALMPGATPRYVPAWGKLLVGRASQLIAYPFNPVTGDTTGPGVRIADRVMLRSPIFAHSEYAVSDEGTLVLARRAGPFRAGQVSMAAGEARPVLTFPEKEEIFDHARFSPDGAHVVMMARDHSSQNSIYLWDVVRGVPQLIHSERGAALPTWTSRGDSVVIRVAQEGVFKILAADGSGRPRELPAPQQWAVTRDFSVHGTWMALQGRASGAATSEDIVLYDRDAGGVVRPFAVTAADETDPTISPDGKWLAFTSNETGRSEVYVSPFPNPTAKYPVTSMGGQLPVWSGDSRTIYVDAIEGSFVAIAFTPGTPPVFGASRVVFRRPIVRSWTVSPDGKRMLFIDTMRLLALQGFELVLNLVPGSE